MSYVQKMTTCNRSRIAIESVILLAKRLNMTCVAEGVETEEQALDLKKMGCDKLQGYWLGKPLPAKEFEKQFIP
jgi:EAL domain-containing protein (putative c-di-GMP-specific phosphodiesterase class I)